MWHLGLGFVACVELNLHLVNSTPSKWAMVAWQIVHMIRMAWRNVKNGP
jgi:hypothetical protein